ncbi:MAG: RnfH family protein [Burkholderiaceae bacterium]
MTIQVSVLYSPRARQVEEMVLQLADHSSVLQALQSCGLMQRLSEIELASVGVWGRKIQLGYLLRDLDRVEIYRPLKVDPKVARRERFAKQGAKTTGLFAKKRVGAKAGY